MTCFPQICYDPFEWDYRSYCDLNDQTIRKVYQMGREANIHRETEGHTFHNAWSLMQSQRIYRKAPQCLKCRLRLICDGVAEQYRERFGFQELVPQEGEIVRDPIFFRRHHKMAVGG